MFTSKDYVFEAERESRDFLHDLAAYLCGPAHGYEPDADSPKAVQKLTPDDVVTILKVDRDGGGPAAAAAVTATTAKDRAKFYNDYVKSADAAGTFRDNIAIGRDWLKHHSQDPSTRRQVKSYGFEETDLDDLSKLNRDQHKNLAAQIGNWLRSAWREVYGDKTPVAKARRKKRSRLDD